MSKQKKHEEYVAEVESINPNIEVLERYINNRTPILHRCKIDGTIWKAIPFGVTAGKGCPTCGRNNQIQRVRKSHQKYVDEVALKRPDIIVRGTYINNYTRISHQCKNCNYGSNGEWNPTPEQILTYNSGCPVCCRPPLKIGQPPEYKNSIWASEYKDLFSKYMSEEQMKSIMPNSDKHIIVICDECGKPKTAIPNSIAERKTISCYCGDGNNYPNKFIYAFLQQLKIDFQPEYCPLWAQKKRYDFYIPSINCIIENHGCQHYDYGFEKIHGNTVAKTQQNDLIKQNLAKSNI